MIFWNRNKDFLRQLESKADKAEIAELKALLEQSDKKLLTYLDNLHIVVTDAQEKRITALETKVRALLDKSSSPRPDDSI